MHSPSLLRLPRLTRPLLALLCAACVSEKLPAVEAGGHSLWQRVETEHFVVESNIPEGDGVREVASDFETLWYAFASVPILGRKPPAVKPIVVLLDAMGEYRYFAGSQTDGVFYPDGVLGPLIVLPPNSSLFQDVVVKHELAHFMSSQFLRNAPMWLHEGLAEVMETAEYDTDKGQILFGDFLRGRVDGAATKLPAATFMNDWPTGSSREQLYAYYARSWLLVHWLIDEHLKEFGDFLVRVSAGDDWKTAWAVIPVRLDDLDDALNRYYYRAQYGLWTVRARLPDRNAFVESTAPLADAFALRSVLQAYASNPARAATRTEAAQRDLEAAATLDPGNARVQKIQAAAAEAAR